MNCPNCQDERSCFASKAPAEVPNFFCDKFEEPKTGGLEKKEAQKVWNTHYESMYFKWRWYYADRMLEEKSKQG